MVASSDTDAEVQDRASEAGGHVIKYESMDPAKVTCPFYATTVCVENACCLQIAAECATVRIGEKGPVLLVMGSENGPLSTHHHGQAAQVLKASTFQQAVRASHCDVYASRWGGHYARDVQVLLDSQGNKLEEPYHIAMVYAAAPCTSSIPYDQFRADMKAKVLNLLRICYKEGHVDLMLGAWGCGDRDAPVKEVATIFHDALLEEREVVGAFLRVTFAIFQSPDGLALAAFEQQFIKGV